MRGCQSGSRRIARALAAAAARIRTPQPRSPLRAQPPVAADPADPIPIAALIETSRKHFEAGERELKVGHLEQARAEFDRAVDVLLESPYGARTDARIREHFDRLVDRISAYEVTALAQGDGFAEKKYEPASIDELLKIATFPKPDADAADDCGGQAGPGTTDTTSRFRRTPRAGVRRAVPGPAARLHPGRPDARHASTCR